MRILLVPDVPNWAFDRDASAVIKYLPEYDIDKTYNRKFRFAESYKKYDLIHFMTWLEGKPYCQNVSAGVSSHNWEYLHLKESKQFFPKYRALITTSKFLYDKVKGQNKHVFYAPGGVHHDMFYPKKRSRNRKFIVGWTGQKTTGKIDIKGYNLILLPLIESLKSHRDIDFKLLTKNHKNAIPYEQMPQFYDNIDCQICTSMSEGAPNPMFEAASSGIPLVSTKVGAISELIEESKGGYLIDSYGPGDDVQDRIKQFRDKILFLKNNRKIAEKMGKNNRELVETKWAWKHTVKRWKPMFKLKQQDKEI